ncbi:MAG: hypothetical protein IBX57_00255 [Gammaproteobacteria bacterium]|nr:hypothetical protein [Gammaproteobacteria bacterium]
MQVITLKANLYLVLDTGSPIVKNTVDACSKKSYMVFKPVTRALFERAATVRWECARAQYREVLELLTVDKEHVTVVVDKNDNDLYALYLGLNSNKNVRVILK